MTSKEPKFKGEGFVERICLRCNQSFPSRSKFNRLCEACRKHNHKFSGMNMAEHQQFRKGNGTAGRSE